MALSKMVVETFYQCLCTGRNRISSKILKSTAKEDCSEHLCVANSTGRRIPKPHRKLAVLAAVQSCPFPQGKPNLLLTTLMEEWLLNSINYMFIC